MLLKKISGRNFIINLLADFIVEKLGNDVSSKINVIDVGNFFIVKGQTSSKVVLNLSDLTTEFEKKYSSHLNDSKVSKTIDLIEYDVNLSNKEILTQSFFNTENCSYHHKQIELFKKNNQTYDFEFITKPITEEELLYSSEFPHGYSLNQGRLLYYFMKKIFYSLPPSYPVTSLTMTIDTNNEEYVEVFDNFTQYSDEVIQSAILDCVNLNLEKLEKKIIKPDYEKELLDPLKEHDFLLEEKFDIVII